MCRTFRIERKFFGRELKECFFRSRFFSSPDFSGPEGFVGFGPVSLAQRKKRLCNSFGKCEFQSSVAISAQYIKLFGCKDTPRCCACAGIKDNIMVIIAKKEGIAMEEMKEDDWTSGTCAEIAQKMTDRISRIFRLFIQLTFCRLRLRVTPCR